MSGLLFNYRWAVAVLLVGAALYMLLGHGYYGCVQRWKGFYGLSFPDAAMGCVFGDSGSFNVIGRPSYLGDIVFATALAGAGLIVGTRHPITSRSS